MSCCARKREPTVSRRVPPKSDYTVRWVARWVNRDYITLRCTPHSENSTRTITVAGRLHEDLVYPYVLTQSKHICRGEDFFGGKWKPMFTDSDTKSKESKETTTPAASPAKAKPSSTQPTADSKEKTTPVSPGPTKTRTAGGKSMIASVVKPSAQKPAVAGPKIHFKVFDLLHTHYETLPTTNDAPGPRQEAVTKRLEVPHSVEEDSLKTSLSDDAWEPKSVCLSLTESGQPGAGAKRQTKKKKGTTLSKPTPDLLTACDDDVSNKSRKKKDQTLATAADSEKSRKKKKPGLRGMLHMKPNASKIKEVTCEEAPKTLKEELLTAAALPS
ncbi:unnamed protein product, partial [Mesorhabditis spiculigera]